MLVNLPDGSPNPNTHAYGHKDLAREERFVADMLAAPGTDLIIEHREQRFIKNHERVLKKLRVMPQAENAEELELKFQKPWMSGSRWSARQRQGQESLAESRTSSTV